MNSSVLAACLVILVAVCDVRAQWNDCNCRFNDVCVERRGRLMCRRESGGFYTPLGGAHLGGQQVVIGGQGLLRSGLINQGLVNQGLVNHGLDNRGLVNQGFVSRHLGQAIVDRGLVGAGLLGARPEVQTCCYQRDFFTCAVSHLGNRYINGRTCTKYYFDGHRCEKLTVNTDCLSQRRPRNMFDSYKECMNKCDALVY